MNIGIVGLGLIGGSMAKAFNARTAHGVYGADLSDETMLLARLSGAISGELTQETLCNMDIVLLAVNPCAAIRWARENAKEMKPGALLVDFCGVKRRVVDEIGRCAREAGVSYIGGHPMAGREKGKFVSSRENLFDGAPMILTPGPDAAPEALETLNRLFTDIGFSRMVFTSPDEHDRIIAYTSQLAHVASSAYVKSPEALRQRGFSAGSFRDMTRVAQLDEDMWTELFLLNADYLETQLGLFIQNLQEYQRALSARDDAALRALLRDGREKKALAGGN